MPKFLKQSSKPIEQSWYDAMQSRKEPEIWFDVISKTPIDQWRPDSICTNSEETPKTLFEHWLFIHNKEWVNDIKTVCAAYPDIHQDIIVNSMFYGMHAANLGTRVETFGNEDLLLHVFNNYSNTMKIEQAMMDALLCRAVQCGFTKLTTNFLKLGGNPQKSLSSVRDAAIYDILISNGADPFKKIERSPYEILPTHLKVSTGISYYNPAVIKDETIFDNFFQSDDSSFISSVERTKILTRLSSIALKYKKNSTAEFEQSRSEYFFRTIYDIKKDKDVKNIIKTAGSGTIWDWTTNSRTDPKVKISTLAFLILTENSLAINEFSNAIPESKFGEVDSSGRSILHHIIVKYGSLRGFERVSDKISNTNTVTAQEIFSMFIERLNSKKIMECPIYNQETNKPSLYTHLCSLGVGFNNFWTCAEEYSKAHGDSWAIELSKIITTAILNKTYTSSETGYSKEWVATINKIDISGVAPPAAFLHLKFIAEFITEANDPIRKTYDNNELDEEFKIKIRAYESIIKRYINLGHNPLEFIKTQEDVFTKYIYNQTYKKYFSELIHNTERILLQTKSGILKPTKPQSKTL